MIMDSTMNWIRIELLGAPSALRVPISRVRSVIETSMMFMTPIPPTSREMAAIREMAMVIVPRTSLIVFAMLSKLKARTT